MRHAVLTLLLTLAPVARLASQSPGDLAEVESALRNGEAWHATVLLRPKLASASTRTPEVIIAAAQAAAGWEGWATVDRLLDGQDWLDSRFDRLARRLLAQSALAQGQTARALEHARRAIPGTVYPRTDTESATRWVLLGRVHERMTAWDSSASAYIRAAPLMPELSDWFTLRAAGVTADSARRVRLYATVTRPAARARVAWTEAMALARFGRREDAARQYAALGAAATALRLRWEASGNATSRARVAVELFDMIRNASPRAQVRQALEIVEGYSVTMARSESLLVARRAVEFGRASQANALFTNLNRSGTLTPEEMMAWGEAESALGRWDAAARSFATVRSGPLAGRAAYYRARAFLRAGNVGTAIELLEQIPGRFPTDTFAAGTALYLLGDLALDNSRPDSTRALFNRLHTRYPSSEYAQRAALIAPLIAFGRGDHPAAQRELEAALRERKLTGFDDDAGNYWLGRNYMALGHREMAAARFRELLARGPENYYALRAAARLDTLPWRRPAGALALPTDLPEALTRAMALDALGLGAEADFERDAFTAAATNAAAQVGAGAAFLAAGDPARATRLGFRALENGAARDAAVLELLYPLPYQASLEASAKRVNLDPWLAAAVIRQESAFNPRATSGAGARGLMQVMPANGPALARAVGISDFDPALLWQPEVNLAMGTRHLAGELSRYPELERVLAAYNAGGGRVSRWSRTLLSGGSADAADFDAELFVERIPYLETRVYIRNITVNRAMYGMLYGR